VHCLLVTFPPVGDHFAFGCNQVLLAGDVPATILIFFETPSLPPLTPSVFCDVSTVDCSMSLHQLLTLFVDFAGVCVMFEAALIFDDRSLYLDPVL